MTCVFAMICGKKWRFGQVDQKCVNHLKEQYAIAFTLLEVRRGGCKEGVLLF